MEEYDASRFYIHSTDKRGHSTQVRVSLPPDQMRRMSQLVQSGKYPYRTYQDFLRDAMIHRMASLGEQDDEAKVIANEWTVAALFAEVDERYEVGEKILDSARRQFSSIETEDDRVDLKGRLQNALAQPLSSRHVRLLNELLGRL